MSKKPRSGPFVGVSLGYKPRCFAVLKGKKQPVAQSQVLISHSRSKLSDQAKSERLELGNIDAAFSTFACHVSLDIFLVDPNLTEPGAPDGSLNFSLTETAKVSCETQQNHFATRCR